MSAKNLLFFCILLKLRTEMISVTYFLTMVYQTVWNRNLLIQTSDS